MTDLEGPTPGGPTQPSGPAGDSDQQPPVDRNAVAPATTSGVGEPERPTDELSEELTRTVKAAYQ